MSASLPRRKKRVFCSREAPFPVPIESITQDPANADTWFYYTAYLTGKSVTVRHSGDINFLFKMGFFGKGSLSRSQPDFNQRYRRTRVPHPADVEAIIQPQVQSCRVYKQHLKWADGSDDDDVSDSTQSDDSDGEELGDQRTKTQEIQRKSWETSNEGLSSFNLENDVSFPETNQDSPGTKVPTSQALDKKPDTSWDMEPDTDFWGSGDLERVDKQTVEESWNNDNGDSDFWNSEVIPADEKEAENNTSKQDECVKFPVGDDSIKSELSGERTKTENANVSETKKACLKKPDSSVTVVENQHTSDDKEKTELLSGTSNKIDAIHSDCPEGESIDLDPQCKVDDLDGDVLVIANSDDESYLKGKKRKKRWKWMPVLKKDPYPVVEHLQLSFEESFFLSYGLGCLVVLDENQEVLDLSSLWKRFCSTKSTFLPNYIAYHYYRSKGWVPKSGLKFGCDFIVYKEGPPFYHGSYSVMVRMVEEETQREDCGTNQRHLSWITLSGLNRITEHVAKELLLCYVIKPRGITPEALCSPSCIPRFKVQEMLVSRWVSSQERQVKEVEEFP